MKHAFSTCLQSDSDGDDGAGPLAFSSSTSSSAQPVPAAVAYSSTNGGYGGGAASGGGLGAGTSSIMPPLSSVTTPFQDKVGTLFEKGTTNNVPTFSYSLPVSFLLALLAYNFNLSAKFLSFWSRSNPRHTHLLPSCDLFTTCDLTTPSCTRCGTRSWTLI